MNPNVRFRPHLLQGRIENRYRPHFLILEDRSVPSGLSSLDLSTDLFDSQPDQTHHSSLINDDWHPVKKDQADCGQTYTSPSAPHSHANGTPYFLPTQVATVPVIPLPRGGRTPPPPVVQEIVRASGPAIGNWTVTKAHSETTKTPFGFFTMLNARSYNSLDIPQSIIHTINGTATTLAYGPGATFSTQLTSRSGTKYSPSAQAVATITTFTPPVFVWTGAGTTWGIIVNGPTGVIPSEIAEAAVRIQDPVTFPDLSPTDGSFTVRFAPSGSWDVDFPPQDPDNGIVYSSSVTLGGTATSSVPGYQNLFSYSITLSPGSVSVSVTSNPNLHWGDIATTIANSFEWDGEHMTYNGPPLVASGIPIPTSCATTVENFQTTDGTPRRWATAPAHTGRGGGCAPSASFGLEQDATATVTAPHE